MRKPGRSVSRLLAGCIACASLSPFDALAQSYPVKPIRMLVGYPAGGGTDLTARIVARNLSENLAQSVVVENRPGASGSIANERVATSPPDGYTLLMVSPSSLPQPTLRAKLTYDFQRDLAPVALVVVGPYVLVVHSSVPARNVKELIALARAQPGKLNYGSSGLGSAGHLAGELFNMMASVKLVHVPYKGGSESVIAAVAGEVDMGFPSIASVLPLLKTGKLRALAVLGAKRASFMPSIPTLDESGLPGYDRSTWYGMLAPAGVPKQIISRLNALVNETVNTPEMKASLIKEGLEPQAYTPEQFAAFIQKEIAQNAKLAEMAKAKAE